MCLGDVFNRNKSSAPQAPPTDVTDGEQVTIDQTVTGGGGSRGRYGGQRQGSTNRAGGVKGPRGRSSSTSRGRSSSTSRGRTGTPSSSRGGGRSRPGGRGRGGGRGR